MTAPTKAAELMPPDALANCPFCSGKPYYIVGDLNKGKPVWEISCDTCGYYVRSRHKDIKQVWNRRMTPSQATPPQEAGTLTNELANHIRLLLPLAKGYVAAHIGIRSTAEIVAEAESAIAALTHGRQGGDDNG